MSVKQKPGYRTWRYRFKLGGIKTPFEGDTGVAIERPKSEAEAAEIVIKAEKKKEINQGVITTTIGMRLGDAVRKYWDEHAQYHYKNSEKNLLWIAKVIGEKKPLSKITDTDVKTLIKRRRAEGRVRNGIVDGKQTYRALSLRGVDETTTLLRLVMKHAKKNWKVPIPAMPEWKEHRVYNHRKMKRAGHNIKRALSPDDRSAIAEVETEDCRDLRLFLTKQGMRINEALRLEWREPGGEVYGYVDMERRLLIFSQKGGSDRILAMAPGVFELLQEQQGKHPVKVWTFKCRRSRRRKDPKNPGRLLTTREEGKHYPMTYSYFTGRRYADWWRKAGVKKRGHDLRHSFAMDMIETGVDIRKVSGLLGHSSVEITEQNYVMPVSLEEQREAFAAVARREMERAAPKGAKVGQSGGSKKRVG